MKARNQLNRRIDLQTMEFVEFGLSLRRAFGRDAAVRYMAKVGVEQEVALCVLDRYYGHLRGNGWPDRRHRPQ